MIDYRAEKIYRLIKYRKLRFFCETNDRAKRKQKQNLKESITVQCTGGQISVITHYFSLLTIPLTDEKGNEKNSYRISLSSIARYDFNMIFVHGWLLVFSICFPPHSLLLLLFTYLFSFMSKLMLKFCIFFIYCVHFFVSFVWSSNTAHFTNCDFVSVRCCCNFFLGCVFFFVVVSSAISFYLKSKRHRHATTSE